MKGLYIQTTFKSRCTCFSS